jgi:hypothetical protein
LKFWRINMDSAKGDWHLYNEADDKKFLQDVATRIASGQYNHTRLEWTSVVARLPK